MRELLLGIFLGVAIAMLPAWLERHKMESSIDIVFYGVLALIGLISCWRIILKIISKVNPRLYIWINELNATTPITEEYRSKIKVKAKEKDNNIEATQLQLQSNLI